MYDLPRSCQELQVKCLVFSTQKTHNKGLVQKIIQEKNSIEKLFSNIKIVVNIHLKPQLSDFKQMFTTF